MAQALDWERIERWLFGDRTPVTKLVILANVLTFVVISLFHLEALAAYVGFATTTFRLVPWTAFTYPLLCMGTVIGLLFQGYWLWVAGGSLERAWGSSRFAGFFFLMSGISAMGILIGSMLSGVPVPLEGLWVPLAGVTVAFAAMNPEEQILFFLIIPLKLKYLALIGVAALLVQFGRLDLLLGLFSIAGCASSYWFVRNGMQFGISWPRASRPRPQRRKRSLLSRLNPLSWIRGHRDRKRLRDLFERSYPDDNQQGPP